MSKRGYRERSTTPASRETAHAAEPATITVELLCHRSRKATRPNNVVPKDAPPNKVIHRI